MSAADSKHTPKMAPTPENIGTLLARNMFKSRGNHFEIHLIEADLATLLKGAAEIAIEGVGTENVAALHASREDLKAQNAKLLEACEAAAAFCAELYAKYGLKIGPFSSQAQVVNGKLRAALAKVQHG